MPGIAGIVTRRSSERTSEQLDDMLRIMMHEQYYCSARCERPDMGIHVGCVNVSGSVADCMPVWNETHDTVLLMAGECYADESNLARLSSRGHAFQRGNLSWVVHEFEERKEEIFASLNGWYCGAIIDLQCHKSYLFNDRFGQRRLCYYQGRDALYFSTEAKSLLKILPGVRYLDERSLADFIAYDCVLGERTWFKDVQVIQPGSVWTCVCGNVEKKRAFDPAPLVNQASMDSASFSEDFEATFERVLPRYLSGSSRILALSGGLDTRLILAFSGVRPGDLPCYTHGGMYREMLDVRIARTVARTSHQPHTVIEVGDAFLRDYATHASRCVFISDGLADACQAHLLYCNRAARQIGRIKITGKFGSQLLKGVSALNRPSGYDADLRLITKDMEREVDVSRQALASPTGGSPLSVIAFREIPSWWAGITAIEYSQLDVRSPYLDNDLVALLFRRAVRPTDMARMQTELIRKRNPALYEIMTDKGYGGGGGSAFAAAVRMRYRARNFAAKLYERDKLPGSMHHVVAWVDARLLGPLGVDRHLLGLSDYRHYRTWFRTVLAPYLQEVVLDSRTLSRPYWNAGFLCELVGDHVRGRGNFLTEIRKVLTVELIERELIESV